MEKIASVTYLNCVISRLVYFDVEKFAGKYERVFAINALQPHLKTLRGAPFSSMTNDTLDAKTQRSLTDSINNIHYPRTGSAPVATQAELPTPSKDMKYVSISTSNYSTVYVIADKRTGCIMVGFRGTASPKGMRAYLKASSVLPIRTHSDDNNDGYLIGIFKLVGEMFYTITEAVHMLAKDFLGTGVGGAKGAKLLTTGHSLGGACAQIFTYLWIKTHPRDRVCCNTFGAPRVMNVYAAEKFAALVMDTKRILFRRVVTMGDPIPHLPPMNKSLTATRTYSHPDETRDLDEGGTLVLLCTNFKKTRKMECMPKNAVKRSAKWTRRAKTPQNKKNHGNYLGVRFEKMSHGLFNPLYEVKRNMAGDTICRVIVGSWSADKKSGGTTVSFFNLQMIKTPQLGVLAKMAMKLKKVVATDYAHADVYMTASVFANVVRTGTDMTPATDPLRATAYVALDLEDVAPRPRLICV
jgi:hypothetical protein